MLKLSVRRIEFFSFPKLEKWQAGFGTGNVTIRFALRWQMFAPTFLGTGLMERAEGFPAKPTAAQVFLFKLTWMRTCLAFCSAQMPLFLKAYRAGQLCSQFCNIPE
jgi:hypothetical protein